MSSTFTFVIIDDSKENLQKTKAIAESFRSFVCVGTATNYDEGIDCILEKNPAIVFLEVNPSDSKSKLSFGLINELYRYLPVIPKIIVTSKDSESAFEAIKHGVYDYLVQPIAQNEFRKTIARLNRDFNMVSAIASQPLESVLPEEEPIYSDEAATFAQDQTEEIQYEEEGDTGLDQPVISMNGKDEPKSEVTFQPATPGKPLTICVKSYGDYRYIKASDICYLQADNNSTDIHLASGEMITAFKTLKHFESVLAYPFVRIHNSYIVNTEYVSRIHTGNAVCHIKDSTTKLPFSKSYKENVDGIINTIASGNYLEI